SRCDPDGDHRATRARRKEDPRRPRILLLLKLQSAHPRHRRRVQTPRPHLETMKKAIILGVSGQDGAYLSRLLLEKGYEVHGTSRDAETQPFHKLESLGIRNRVTMHSVSMRDFRELLQVLSNVRPDEIYNLAGQSSVALSFSQPIETMDSIATGELLVLEAIRFLKLPARLYNSGSSECFGEQPDGVASDERT